MFDKIAALFALAALVFATALFSVPPSIAAALFFAPSALAVFVVLTLLVIGAARPSILWRALAFGVAALCLAEPALAQAVATPAPDATSLLASLWAAISPAISWTLIVNGFASWLAMYFPHPAPGTFWWAARWALDAIALNFRNAKNAA
jgi:hypothetical protein